MKLADRILRQLTQVRETSESMLKAFEKPEDWTYQLAPETNHALWFAGHMAVCDNWLIESVASERAKKLEDWHRLFGTGSRPTSVAGNYPPVADVVAVMRERRQVLVEILQECSDETLARAAPEAIKDWCPDFGSVFEGAIWHEALHLGQVSVIRRTFGHRPLFDAEQAETTAK